MVIKDSHNLTEQFIELFENAVNKKLDESSDIITKEIRDKIKIFSISNSMHFLSTLTRTNSKNKKYSKKELIELHKNYRTRWERKPYLTNIEFEILEDGTAHITDIFILIKYDVMNDEITNNIGAIDVLKHVYEVDACHEVGHILDDVLLLEGKNYQEYYEKVQKHDEEAMDEYYEWEEAFFKSFENEEDVTPDDRILKSKKYYNTPGESRADILGGVDREGLLDLIHNALMQNHNISIEVIKDKE